jgi:hypothetical protein
MDYYTLAQHFSLNCGLFDLRCRSKRSHSRLRPASILFLLHPEFCFLYSVSLFLPKNVGQNSCSRSIESSNELPIPWKNRFKGQ